jgi:2-oxoglutarate ferredoxin oxidoreductase subunit gamma
VNEIRISGFGGQGVIRCGYIVGKTAALFDGKHATLTQSFGPEARGSACSAQILVDDKRIRYPYVTTPDTVVAMSQEAYDKYGSHITDDGVLMIDEDLVKPGEAVKARKLYAIPATRIAEQLGNRIVANIVMLGFFTAMTDIISIEAAREALPSSVPSRFAELNVKAFEQGYEYGLALLGKLDEGKEASRKPATPKAGGVPAAKKAAPAKAAPKKPEAPKKAAKPVARKAAAKKAGKPTAKKPAAKPKKKSK